jgi:hypothetical protein
MPPFYIDSQPAVWMEFSMDGSDVNIGWWETDMPFIMTFAFHMPSICHDPEPIAFIS